MSSMQKIQKLVDEIYVIKESTAEINEEMSEKIDELISHQKYFTSSANNTLSKFNSTLKNNTADIERNTRNLKTTYTDAIEGMEKFIEDIEIKKQNKLEALKKKRFKIIASLIIFTIIFVSIDLYLISDVRYRYANSKGIPIGFKKMATLTLR